MARTAKTKAAADQAVTVQMEQPTASPTVNANDDCTEAMHFDLDPKQITSIVNGNRVVAFRNGIVSITVNIKREGSN